MLEILIIEDSDQKKKQILELLEGYQALNRPPDICGTVLAAKKALQAKQYDLVILDIRLPLRDTELPKSNAGMMLLEELHSRTIYKKPYCIVGLTGYLALLKSASHLFADNFWTIISYDESNSLWAERLARKIDYLIETKKSNAVPGEYNYDLGIITALISPEFENVIRLGHWTNENIKGDSTKYVKSTFTSPQKNLNVVAVCAPQMGMTSTAVTATKLINHFHPKYLAMVGITAGVRKKVNIGDVLVADPSWDWGSGKRIAVKGGYIMRPDPQTERLDPSIRAMFQDIILDEELFTTIWSEWPGTKPGSPPRLDIGPCASGACVIADGVTVKDIEQHSRKLIGIEMEAYGLMHAAINSVEPRPKAFSMKAVCDFADKRKDDDFQKYAAFISANLLRRIAMKYF